MRRIVSALTIGVVFVCGLVLASDRVPLKLQAPILLKVLSYDRNLLKRLENDSVVFGLLVKSKKNAEQLERFFKAYEGRTLQMKPLKIETIKYENRASFVQTLQKRRFAAIYVDGAFEAEQLKEIINAAETTKTPLFCGSESAVKLGVSVGLKVENNRPKIVVNLSASRAQGMDLPAKLLKLSQIIK